MCFSGSGVFVHSVNEGRVADRMISWVLKRKKDL